MEDIINLLNRIPEGITEVSLPRELLHSLAQQVKKELSRNANVTHLSEDAKYKFNSSSVKKCNSQIERIKKLSHEAGQDFEREQKLCYFIQAQKSISISRKNHNENALLPSCPCNGDSQALNNTGVKTGGKSILRPWRKLIGRLTTRQSNINSLDRGLCFNQRNSSVLRGCRDLETSERPYSNLLRRQRLERNRLKSHLARSSRIPQSNDSTSLRDTCQKRHHSVPCESILTIPERYKDDGALSVQYSCSIADANTTTAPKMAVIGILLCLPFLSLYEQLTQVAPLCSALYDEVVSGRHVHTLDLAGASANGVDLFLLPGFARHIVPKLHISLTSIRAHCTHHAALVGAVCGSKLQRLSLVDVPAPANTKRPMVPRFGDENEENLINFFCPLATLGSWLLAAARNSKSLLYLGLDFAVGPGPPCNRLAKTNISPLMSSAEKLVPLSDFPVLSLTNSYLSAVPFVSPSSIGEELALPESCVNAAVKSRHNDMNERGARKMEAGRQRDLPEKSNFTYSQSIVTCGSSPYTAPISPAAIALYYVGSMSSVVGQTGLSSELCANCIESSNSPDDSEHPEYTHSYRRPPFLPLSIVRGSTVLKEALYTTPDTQYDWHRSFCNVKREPLERRRGRGRASTLPSFVQRYDRGMRPTPAPPTRTKPLHPPMLFPSVNGSANASAIGCADAKLSASSTAGFPLSAEKLIPKDASRSHQFDQVEVLDLTNISSISPLTLLLSYKFPNLRTLQITTASGCFTPYLREFFSLFFRHSLSTRDGKENVESRPLVPEQAVRVPSKHVGDSNLYGSKLRRLILQHGRNLAVDDLLKTISSLPSLESVRLFSLNSYGSNIHFEHRLIQILEIPFSMSMTWDLHCPQLQILVLIVPPSHLEMLFGESPSTTQLQIANFMSTFQEFLRKVFEVSYNLQGVLVEDNYSGKRYLLNLAPYNVYTAPMNVYHHSNI